jgi:hypothetical protein
MNYRRSGWAQGGLPLLAVFAMSGSAISERADGDWWSLQKLARPTPPAVNQQEWVRNPIDRFVLAKLEAKGLAPAPEANAQVLGRRLHYGLIGLPPDFGVSADVETLLASPHYGERWARHWLDVARFGESNGFEYDQLRPNAWPYRDWVIEALNEDMPYDRFARLQIAGDVLEKNNPGAITATSFLVCGAFDGLKPAGDKQRKIMREDEMADLVGTVAQSFLGLTVNCARCHDHKFDPILQKEYFQMASALAGVHRGDRNVPAGSDATKLRKELDAISKKLAEADSRIRQRLLAQQEVSAVNRPKTPQPVSRWTFDRDLKDEIGQLHGVAQGGARVEGGALVLDGKSAYVASAPLTKKIQARTLEVWVKLDNLGQRGGAAISIQGMNGVQFDAIVFGEREPGRWMSGSSGFSRTKSFGGAEGEKEAANQFVHIAIVYQGDGTITGYRNGRTYGKPYKTGVATYAAGSSQIIFGLRHGTSAGGGRMLAGRIDRAQLYDRALTAEEVALSANIKIVTEAELVAALEPGQRKTREGWKAEIARLSGALKSQGQKRVYTVTPKGAPVRHLLVRGSPFEQGEEVSAGGVSAVKSGLSADFGLKPNAPEGERRKRLAEWVTAPDNPLFARVMMNRIWHYHFGQGLVKTPNDLGFSGGVPSHPELLDWLASEFKAQGWSVKKMHHLIVDSATYRQSSKSNPKAQSVDAGNVLLWRHTPSRLEAEIIRDAILKVAGQLNPVPGGPGFRDFKMYRHKGSWVYDPIDPEGAEFNRRSIYRTWARGSVHPLLAPLDCPDPSAAAPVRSVTTTPLGALSLMNTSFVLRMSDHFAKRLEAGQSDARSQAARGFELAFGRPAKPRELDLTAGFIERNGLAAFCRVLFNSNEFLYVN